MINWTCAAVKIKKAAERLADKLDGVYKYEAPPTNHSTLKLLSTYSGIKFVSEPKLLRSANGCYTFEQCTEKQLDDVAGVLDIEMRRYSRGALSAAYLEQVVICSQVRCGERDHGGFSQLGATTIDSIFIDADDLSDQMHLRRLIHHELFHAFDFHYSLGWHSSGWESLNEPAFAYDHLHLSRNEFSSVPGFLTFYAKSDQREDRADLFSYLMLHYNDVLWRAERDPVLLRKVMALKEMLQKLSPDFSTAFWESVAVYCAHDAQSLKHSCALRSAWLGTSK